MALPHTAQGTLFIVSAPSGAGKTSLVQALRQSIDQLVVSISHTTRARRPGEIHEQNYFFVERSHFEEMITSRAFLEYAHVFDHYYGTARTTVETALSQGRDVLLEIDWQGAQQVRKQWPSCRSIFILPPSLEILQQRLTARAQDNSDVITRRMQGAIAEISHFHEYDYVIVNDRFEEALLELRSIVLAHRLLTTRQIYTHERILAQFNCQES